MGYCYRYCCCYEPISFPWYFLWYKSWQFLITPLLKSLQKYWSFPNFILHSIHLYLVSYDLLASFVVRVLPGHCSQLQRPRSLLHIEWCSNQAYFRFLVLNRCRCMVKLSTAVAAGCIVPVSTARSNHLSISDRCLIPPSYNQRHKVDPFTEADDRPLAYVRDHFLVATNTLVLQSYHPWRAASINQFCFHLVGACVHAIQYISCTHYWESYWKTGKRVWVLSHVCFLLPCFPKT